MPISIVVGGQFGSEGKGKVALHLAREFGNRALIVRVGGSNSGHTAYNSTGEKHALRQLPAGGVDGNPMLIAPGSYLDVDVLMSEIEDIGATPDSLFIDEYAKLITCAHKRWERSSDLVEGIGSTASGTGAAVLGSIARKSPNLDLQSPRAKDDERLKPFLKSTHEIMDRHLREGGRIIVEGTQGYGLSLNHGEWPYVTSRDTTAAAFLSEIGRAPSDVDDVVLVIRSYPIRVAGNSGHLPHEITWEKVRKQSGAERDLTERTTVTKKIRRVGEFDEEIVKKAIAANGPHRIVLNHVDFIDVRARDGVIGSQARDDVRKIEQLINRNIDMLGISEFETIARPTFDDERPNLRVVS